MVDTKYTYRTCDGGVEKDGRTLSGHEVVWELRELETKLKEMENETTSRC